MLVTVTISDGIVRQAQERGMPVVDFVEDLIDRGLKVTVERPVMHSAIERIRALSSNARGEKG